MLNESVLLFSPDEPSYPGTDTPIHSYVFCGKHLESCQQTDENYLNTVKDTPLILPDFVNHIQSQEAQAIVRIFASQECHYRLEPIAPDGWRIFRSIARVLGRDFFEFLPLQTTQEKEMEMNFSFRRV